jgi:RNA polymerase sigma-70 factor, ECF subfamily
MAEIRSDEEDKDLVQRFRRGDSAAIEELYQLYFDRIYSMAFNQVGRNHKNTEEVVQETWLAVVGAARTFKGNSKIYTWIYTIAWHKIKDFQRKHYSKLADQQVPISQSIIKALGVIDSEPLPDEIVESEETRNLVRGALSSLPGHYQQVLTLRYMEEMSAIDIGEVIGKSSKAVDGLLQRARLALRDQIRNMSTENAG